MTSLSEDTANPSEVLAKAALRAAVAMKIDGEQLATVLGVDTDFVGVVIEPTRPVCLSERGADEASSAEKQRH